MSEIHTCKFGLDMGVLLVVLLVVGHNVRASGEASGLLMSQILSNCSLVFV